MSDSSTTVVVQEYPEHLDIELSRPIAMGGVKVTSLRMREPTAADILIAKKTPGDELAKDAQLYANLCGVPVEDVQKLPVRDYAKLDRAYCRFTL